MLLLPLVSLPLEPLVSNDEPRWRRDCDRLPVVAPVEPELESLPYSRWLFVPVEVLPAVVLPLEPVPMPLEPVEPVLPDDVPLPVPELLLPVDPLPVPLDPLPVPLVPLPIPLDPLPGVLLESLPAPLVPLPVALEPLPVPVEPVPWANTAGGSNRAIPNEKPRISLFIVMVHLPDFGLLVLSSDTSRGPIKYRGSRALRPLR